ncbi:MAG: 2-dehydropantoate 2-reductase [Pseudomonadota bacterium]
MAITQLHNVVVFGAGSIGCYLGGLLLHAGLSVQFIGRERVRETLTTRGLTLTHYANRPLRLKPEQLLVYLDPHGLTSPDIVLVTVKSQDTAEAGRALQSLVGPDTLVISFQNGMGNAERLRESLPGVEVLSAMVPFNVTSTGPGQWHCGTEGELCIAQSQSGRLQNLQQAFVRSGQKCDLIDDIAAVQWGKLLVNLNNALNALSGGTLFEGLMQRDYRRALALMIEEGLDIVRCAGIEPHRFGRASPDNMIRILRLPDIVYRLIMNRILKIDKSARSSMLDDLEMGRPSEVDYLQGQIVELASQIGVEAPVNQRVLELTRAAFDGSASPRLSGRALYQQLAK